ncbi:ABC transporter permease [Bradyrhizobium xenonodulans]|uniref:ABC transporter permease n=1 Tax=Bradyrhizobium xenonodulans TaxID=2736875 RepID=A0ABY7MJD2_9BRAD|nr:ABC transporter permease [Bradyrhizobium xenonodulans]WBL76772.1 ABC transporter permease [Bradyrhizobium xenonodulans]
MAKPTFLDRGTPWLLSMPALLLFLGLLAVPLTLTAILSLNAFDGMRGIQPALGLQNYAEILLDSYYHQIFLRTAGMALGVTFICILLGVPETLILSRMTPLWRGSSFAIILGPLLISVVVRTLGWSVLLGNRGLVNSVLLGIGLIDQPLRLLFSMTGVIIVLTHVFLPFMIIAVWSALQRLDRQVEHAARSLGATSTSTFFRIILPQLMPGILSGAIIVFALSASAFATPSIIGGRRVKVVATATYDEFLNSLNWPLGAAIAVLLLVAIVLVIVGSNRLVERRFKEVFT